MGILASSHHLRQKKFFLKTSFLLLAIFLFLGGIVGLFYVQKFRIKEIAVEGTVNLGRGELEKEIGALLEERIFGVLPGDNIFILRKEKIRDKLLEKFLRLKKISLRRDFFDKLSVSVEEREAEALWCKNEETCAFIDEAGFIFESAPLFSGWLFLKFFDERSNPSGIGKFLLSSSEFQKLRAFREMLRKRDLKAAKIILADDGIYKIYLSEGWYLLLSDKNEPDSAFDNLELVLEKNIKEKKSALEYIDLRLDKKVFFKYK